MFLIGAQKAYLVMIVPLPLLPETESSSISTYVTTKLASWAMSWSIWTKLRDKELKDIV